MTGDRTGSEYRRHNILGIDRDRDPHGPRILAQLPIQDEFEADENPGEMSRMSHLHRLQDLICMIR
jgi:hypothetical protein